VREKEHPGDDQQQRRQRGQRTDYPGVLPAEPLDEKLLQPVGQRRQHGDAVCHGTDFGALDDGADVGGVLLDDLRHPFSSSGCLASLGHRSSQQRR
jgi:hypothetical protein